MKTRHMAKLVRNDGAVVALCVFPELRMIDLRRASWTNRPAVVTCRKCRAALAPDTASIAWQCSGCLWGFPDPWQKTCPACGREGYWSGSVHPSAKPWAAPDTAKEP